MTGAVSNSPHTNIAICSQVSRFVNSQKILAPVVLNVSSTIDWNALFCCTDALVKYLSSRTLPCESLAAIQEEGFF